MRVEYLTISWNTMLDFEELHLSQKSVNQLVDGSMGEDFALQSDIPQMLEDAKYNSTLIAEGIGVRYEHGDLVLRHRDQVRRFRGSSVERWNSLTGSDREYCISLMGLEEAAVRLQALADDRAAAGVA